MKKVIIFFITMLFATVLIACSGEEKPVADLISDVSSTISAYNESRVGSAAISAQNGDETLTTTIYFDFTDRNEINDFGYVQTETGMEEVHVYVKDNIAYVKMDGKKNKSSLSTSSSEAQAIVNSWRFSALAAMFNDYFDNDFSNALVFKKSRSNIYTYELDLSVYNGKINTEGKDSYTVNAAYNGEVLLYVEIVVKVGKIESKVKLEFFGLNKSNITYPGDLDTYTDAIYE